MRKKENSAHKMFNLDQDVISLIEQGSNIGNMNQSEFIEFLVNGWDESLNPIKKLKALAHQKKDLKKEVEEIEGNEEKITDNLQKIEEWRKMKQEKKPEIIRNLVRVIGERRPEDAEVIARNQSIRLGIPATQLLIEAMAQIKEGGFSRP